jgi:hypothetical protein
MKKRKLQDGDEVSELDKPVFLIVHTKCPEKYKLTDMETGEEYIGKLPNEEQKYWRKIS